MHKSAKPRTPATSVALLALSLLLLVGACWGDASSDSSGTFFLKAGKNVPRIGRRSGGGGDNTFFLKTTKNVPRIGRRGSPWGGSGLIEMRGDNGGLPWFRNADSPIPSRAVRTGPASIAALWDGPLRTSHYLRTNQDATAPQLGWHGVGGEQEVEGSSVFRYDLEDDLDEEGDEAASQILAPPPPAQFQRLPLEGSFPRQRRDEDLE